MSDFLTRLTSEKEELSIKINSLESFFETGAFTNLSIGNQLLLKDQALAMHKYFDILRIRLDLLSK